MEDKDNKKNRSTKEDQPEKFQPKVLAIWFVIFATIIGLWSLYTPQQMHRETWTISQVLQAANDGLIVRGVIKSDPSRGPEWYIITGEAKRTEQTVSPSGSSLVGTVFRFESQGRLTNERFNTLLNSPNGSNIVEKPANTILMELVVTLLPFLIIIGLLYFLFVRQLKMAGRGAMSFGKSRAKLLTRDKEQALFKDVAGCDEAKEEVQEIVEFLRNPKKFQKIGGKIPKGVLMVGPPGTGKTLLAKAVAGEAEVPFFSISGSDFVEMFVGVGAARVRDMFEQGRKNAPCIIFIDEIDAVGRQRGAGLGGGNDEREQTLNSLLVEMDGFDGHEGIIIIAATNRPDVLDNALLRPGRFDRQIMIGLPDLRGREEILKVHAKKIKLDKSVDLNVVARNTPGFSGADEANLLNEAALLAARHNKTRVYKEDIDEARDKIAFGREHRKLMDEDDKKITAYHEAGHALIQAVIDDGHLPIHKVTIIPRGQSLGSTMFIPKKDILNERRNHLLNQICCGLGGRIAEDIIFDDITSGAAGDIKMVTKIARRMVCDWGMSPLGMVALGENRDHVFLGREIARDQNYSEETAKAIDKQIKHIIDEQYKRAKEIIMQHRDVLEKIAQSLLEYETIEGIHVHEILEHGSIKTPILKAPSSENSKQSIVDTHKQKDEKKDKGLHGPAHAGAPA